MASIQNLVAKRQNSKKYFNLLAYTAIGIALCVIVNYKVANWSIYNPVKPNRSALAAILAGVEDKSLIEKNGIVVLPNNLASASITGRAYVTVDGPDVYIFVPAWIGRKTYLSGSEFSIWGNNSPDDWVEGYLYSGKKLIEDPKNPFVLINVPAFASPQHAKQDDKVQIIQMAIDHPIENNWYSADSFS